MPAASPTRLPPSLSPVVSSSIGAADRDFWPARRGGRLAAEGGDIRASFTPQGAKLQASRGTLDLTLSGIRRGERLWRVATASPRASRNRVLYRHKAVEEYYRNGPYGLEQSFTVDHRPHGNTRSLALDVALGGTLIPRQVGSHVEFDTPAGLVGLRYDQLQARDATGRPLAARMRLSAGRLELEVDDWHARYPLRIDPFVTDPFVQQGQALTGARAVGEVEFGSSVALSSDGNTALVGGVEHGFDGGGTAWVFTRVGSTWIKQAELRAQDMRLGNSVALSADGNTAVIGGYLGFFYLGYEVWVFTRSASTWSQQGPPLVGEGSTEMGEHVAVSADGNTLIASDSGSYSSESGSISRGAAAWVYTRNSGGQWAQQARLLPELRGELIGGIDGVAISADGRTAVVSCSSPKATFVYERAGSSWGPPVAEVVGPGGSVALSADGSTALIGDPSDNESAGAVWAIARKGSSWALQSNKLTGIGEEGILFGTSVALTEDGGAALVSAPGDAAWVLVRSGSTWSELGPKFRPAESGVGGLFGAAVALSGDGNTALIGAPAEVQEHLGAAFVFTHPLPLVTTGAASAVTQRTATLGATVNPGGGAIGECWVEYGPTTSYGSTAPCLQDPGSDTNPVAVSASAGALAANRAYHYRAFARNPAGAGYGDDATFTTLPDPPTVTTEPPSSVGPGYATLSASVNPNGARVTSCRFEYGASSGYGASLPCSPQALEGESPLAVSATAPVDADAGYHFRIVASNSGGGSYGADQTFTTPKPPTPPLPQLQSTMTWLFGWSKQYTKVRSLVVHNLPLGAHVEVACTGRGCPVGRSHSATLARRKRCHKRKCAKVKHRLAQGPTVDLTSLFTGRRLSVGAQISVSVTKPGWNGKSFRFTTRPSRIPTIQIACLAPGSRRPGVGC